MEDSAVIEYRPGADIFATGADMLVNPVNCVGVAGAGLALAMRRRFPRAYDSYRAACANKQIAPGVVHVHERADNDAPPRWIVALPTKRHWRDRSRLSDIDAGLQALATIIERHRPTSVALPRVGCGLGGADWTTVHEQIIDRLESVSATSTIIVLGTAPTT